MITVLQEYKIFYHLWTVGLPELRPRQLAVGLAPHHRAVPACVRIVSGGTADGADVVPEDRADHSGIGRFQRVWTVNPRRLPVLLAEAAEVRVRWGPTAAGVRHAADRWRVRGDPAHLPAIDVSVAAWSPRGVLWCCCASLGGIMVLWSPVMEPLQQRAQVHVVMPHVESPNPDLTLHFCHVLNEDLSKLGTRGPLSGGLYRRQHVFQVSRHGWSEFPGVPGTAEIFWESWSLFLSC